MLPAPNRPELHEIDLSGIEPAETVIPEDPSAETVIPEAAPMSESTAMSGEDALPGHGSGKGNGTANGTGNGADGDGGPPTEAMLVIEDEVADNGRAGPAARRRP
jgi:hypothetical protein